MDTASVKAPAWFCAAPVMDKLWGAVHAAMQDKAVDDNLVSGGSEIVAESKPEEFRAGDGA